MNYAEIIKLSLKISSACLYGFRKVLNHHHEAKFQQSATTSLNELSEEFLSHFKLVSLRARLVLRIVYES